MKIYSVIIISSRGGNIDGATPIGVYSNLEQAKQAVNKEVQFKWDFDHIHFELNEDGTGAVSSRPNEQGENEEIRTIVCDFDLDVTGRRLKTLDLYINYILIGKLFHNIEDINKEVAHGIEDNKIKTMFKGSKYEHTYQYINDDELRAIKSFAKHAIETM